MFLQDGDRKLVFASKGGAPEHPTWYANIVAEPRVMVQDGPEPHDFVARELGYGAADEWGPFDAATNAAFEREYLNRLLSRTRGNVARVRELLAMAPRAKEPEKAKAADTDQPCVHPRPCPCCGGRMLIIETFAPGCEPKYRPAPTMPAIRIDTS
mgnify:CR=1 FL=1